MEREPDFFLQGIAKVETRRCARTLFFLNCVAPGSGSILSAFVDTSSAKVNYRSIGYGLLQMLLTVAFMLGWFWSIYHGFLLCTHATEGQKFIENEEGDECEDQEKQLIEPNNEM